MFLQLEDEPPLTFSRMYAMDGNSSLKRIAMSGDRTAGDTRVLSDSSYFLSQEYVDRFANEVRGRRTKNRSVKKRTTDDSSDEDDDASVSGSVEGDPTDGLETATTSVTDVLSAQTSGPMHVAEPSSAEEVARAKQLEACVKNWKAASSEDKKKMWGVFDEAGVFASACRHGLILWVADMLRSGEL